MIANKIFILLAICFLYGFDFDTLMSMENKKIMRLDKAVAQHHPEVSRQQIQQWIKDGLVLVDGVVQQKTGYLVDESMSLIVNAVVIPYVSRAGIKLAQALDSFNINVMGLTVLDAGLSTGGFSDCLLQRGAKKIFGVDVGHDQVHRRIAKDPRLVVMERTNLKELVSLPEFVDIATLDLSFISVLKVMDAVVRLLKPGGMLVVLIKPQFESGVQHRGKKGVITDPKVHQMVIDTVTQGVMEHGFVLKGVIESPLLGGSGNKEFLGYFVKNI